MLVLAHVSSIKTTRAGSIDSCEARHAARFSTTSGRSCSLAISVFFFESSPALYKRRRSFPSKPLRQVPASILLVAHADKCRIVSRSWQQANLPRHATLVFAEPPFLARLGQS